MGTFEYQAIDQQGKVSRGTIEADTAKIARQRLRESGHVPTRLDEITAAINSKDSPFFSRRISNRDLALMTRQFSVLLKSGLPLSEVLTILSKQTSKKRIQKIIYSLRSSILEGRSLSDAIALLGQTFPPLYKASIAAGETSGKLVEIFENLADYLEEKADIHQKIKLSLLYPVILTIVSISVITGLLVFVIPEIVSVFESLEQQLPEITMALINTSEYLKTHGIFILLGLGVMAITVRLLLKVEKIRLAVHRLILKLPLLGQISTISNTARFTRTLAILSKSEVETINSLNIASQVLANQAIKQAVETAAQMVREGSSISQALNSSGYFPELTIQLISSGETSGNLSDMLDSTARYHEREIQSYTSTLVGIFEPVLILAMGGIVLTIVIAILLPIFEMNQLVG